MLEYHRIDVSKGTDVNKTILSKECDICHYWYFKDIGFNPIQDGGGGGGGVKRSSQLVFPM